MTVLDRHVCLGLERRFGFGLERRFGVSLERRFRIGHSEVGVGRDSLIPRKIFLCFGIKVQLRLHFKVHRSPNPQDLS